jgi:hypothetical protein
LRKLSINRIPGFLPKVNIIFEKFNIDKKQNPMFGVQKFLEKLFKAAMKTVPPTSIKQLSILSIKTIKKLFWGDF